MRQAPLHFQTSKDVDSCSGQYPRLIIHLRDVDQLVLAYSHTRANTLSSAVSTVLALKHPEL